ncbi:hypothetical protein [Hymenobacter sp. PAMC 26628]|uniref:hypothetical protein n=1 Tax=Hymenobacter sp. PAMC 26628 TaxID=1484118 RepID=UPI0007703EEA|nr:hypothetical protein [Hymenobacter sp. PAMC 26628]AMJ67678.1 hypothetical protein AXW84_21355 [Hymenobacter sp. PAMC 26628]
MPTLSPPRPPRDSRRWRQAAQRNRPADGLENRRFLWVLAATIAVVVGVVGVLLAQSIRSNELADRPSSFEQPR